MENNNIKEGMNILKKLSPKNQTYFMTLLRLAEAAEDGARSEMNARPANPKCRRLNYSNRSVT